MKKNKRLYLYILLAVTAINIVGVHAQQISTADSIQLMHGLQEMAESLKTIQSDFYQEKHLSFMKAPIRSTGKFYYQKQNHIRWEYVDPYKYIIVLSDGNIQINDAGKQSEFNMSGSKIFEEINAILVATVSGDISNNNRFLATLGKSENNWKVTLKPSQKEISAMLSTIVLYISPDKYHVQSIKMIEPNNDFTLISFNNQKFNAPLPQHIFTVH